MISWWIVYGQQKFFPHDIFAIKLYFPRNGLDVNQPPQADNFTIPMTTFSTYIMLTLMIPLTYEPIRRKSYELFLYCHHFFMVVFTVALWHA
jgi:hypothetical protein